MKYSLIGLVLLAAACAAYERSDEATRAQSRMVGMRDDQIRTCAGKPQRVEQRGETEIWTYDSGGEDLRDRGEPAGPGSNFSDVVPGEDPIPKRYCVVRFFMTNERVSQVTYSGVTGGVFSRGEQCAFVVANCLR